MHYGLTLPNFGDFFDPRVLARLAREAEDAGWDGFFLWDHVLLWPTPMVDPWIALAAVALATERIRLGPLVTPLPRRRIVKLARETVSLDHLSNGRLILGVGSGSGPWEWEYLGDEPDPRTRGAMLDEGLDLLTRLWTGEPVLHQGRYYTFRGAPAPDDPAVAPTPFLPAPLQTPRIPIWVAGTWPHKAPFRRAARWDGVVPLPAGGDFGGQLAPDAVRDIATYVRAHRTRDTPFEVVVGGHTAGEDAAADQAVVARYADAGTTWWLEDVSPWAFGWRRQGPWPTAAMEARIRRGPPRA